MTARYALLTHITPAERDTFTGNSSSPIYVVFSNLFGGHFFITFAIYILWLMSTSILIEAP